MITTFSSSLFLTTATTTTDENDFFFPRAWRSTRQFCLVRFLLHKHRHVEKSHTALQALLRRIFLNADSSELRRHFQWVFLFLSRFFFHMRGRTTWEREEGKSTFIFSPLSHLFKIIFVSRVSLLKNMGNCNHGNIFLPLYASA